MMNRTSLLTVFATALMGFGCGPSPREGVVDAAGSTVDGSTSTADAALETTVFAHTASALYRVNPDSLVVTKVSDFRWPNGNDSMTDIAIDQNGGMVGISFDKVYRVDPLTARATLLSAQLRGRFNGLSYVPADLIGRTGADVLIGSRAEDGKIFSIDPNTGIATEIGDMLGGLTSSGDIVAVKGLGVLITTDGGLGNDELQRLSQPTLKATKVGNSNTGFSSIWGVAFWKDKIFGFSESGDFVLIDRATGVGTLVKNEGVAWWGAAVTTLAPVVE
jgi:hypothetical protein